MRAFCHFKAWEFTSEPGLVNMLPAKAIEARHVQHKAIQHSNALSLGSHFNHSLFSATVPAGCKLCWAVINPCQVREEEEEGGEGKRMGNELKYEVPLIRAAPTPLRTHTYACATLFCIHEGNLGPPRSWGPPTVLSCF